MCAAIRWERPLADVLAEQSHAAVLLRTARDALLRTSLRRSSRMTLTLPMDQLTSGQLMDMALDMAAANRFIAEVAERANHVDVRLTRQYRAFEGGRR